MKEIERRKQKNKKKKQSHKKKKLSELNNGDSGTDVKSGSEVAENTDEDLSAKIEYVSGDLQIDPSDPNYAYFSKIFEAFRIGEDKEEKVESSEPVTELKKEEAPTRASISEKILQEEMSEKRREQEAAGEVQTMSKRKLRLAMQPSIAELKETTTRPDVVEWADVTSRDPQLLVTLKAYRNTVPVPRHWNAKRKYLAGKRGFERPPFDLPDFIKKTGIMEMRETMWEKEDAQSMKSKMRERARPKLGRIDIDYQKLHDAFFKWQTKPQMTQMGELYYEGKELETIMREKKCGELSDELRIALGMPVGPNAHKFPPPWLIAMQRYGPPPSYPNLKIPGLNCPIPEGCSFGYHAGGWGKPPVDQFNKPLYGDVFGVETSVLPELDDESRIERRHWGEIGSDESSSEESEEEEEEEGVAETGFVTPGTTEGFVTPSGMTSGVPTGVETPDTIELRKGKRMEESLAGGDTPAPTLYTVLPERKVERIAGQMMASSHVYDLTKKTTVPAPAAQGDTGVEVSLNPDDLDLADQKGLEKKYEEQLRKQTKGRQDDEDFSDMVAEHSAKQNRKRKAQEQKKTTQQQKKYKDFKF
uniref:PSP domain-containing protein n=1 Tax=Syphacia muris TaxID=451379 RepID=A0A0N5AW05_9BILA